MTRPQASTAAGVASLLGSHLAGASFSSGESWAAALAVFFIVACSNLVNDIVDAEGDAVDRRQRPLASGEEGRRGVTIAALVLAVAGLAEASMVGLVATVVASGFLIAGVAYSLVVRRVPLLGHVWVALMFGGTVVWGGWATAGATASGWMAGALVALFLLPRELLKSIGDVRGDRLSGWRTAAVVWGREGTVLAITSTSILFAVATAVPVLSGVGGAGYLLSVWLGTVLPLLGVVVWLWRHPDAELRPAEFLTGLMWFPGLAALWLLGPSV